MSLWNDMNHLQNSIDPDNDEQFGVLEQALQDVQSYQQKVAKEAERLAEVVSDIGDEISDVIDDLDSLKPDDNWQVEIEGIAARLATLRTKLY